MKRAGMMTLVMTVGLLVGSFLFTSLAEATTTLNPVVIQNATGRALIFFIGEDSNVWYTVFDAKGDRTTSQLLLDDGNADNPYAIAFKASSGFVVSSGTNRLDTACSTVGSTICPATSGIYAKVPGSILCKSAPGASYIGNGVSTGTAAQLPTSLGTNFQFYAEITCAGNDNSLWYTLYDLSNLGFAAGGFGNNTAEPFAGAGEQGNSGFISSGGLATRCTAVGRTCISGSGFARHP